MHLPVLKFTFVTSILICLLAMETSYADQAGASQQGVEPNIILVMADDQGWGQTGYNNNPILKTPNLDRMASSGLRFDRFYAAAPVCSPTRASVLTGRTNRRTGVESHGYALRLQEKTIAMALKDAGYATGHFGKWHLNGMRGPGVPIFAADTHNPGTFGFQTWLSVTNFFDRNPIMSRVGKFESFIGDSSEVIVEEAIKFIQQQAGIQKPSFTVIWFGTPHNPFMASEEDAKPFSQLDRNSQDQHGELVAMDRSIGTLRNSLRELGIADNTILWFTSDNGGLPKIKPSTVGGLRGFKGSVYEGGLRVPAIVEWPSVIRPRITKYPAVSMDIFPTLAEIVGLSESTRLLPQDGLSLRRLFDQEIGKREKPIPFDCLGNKALIDNDWKLIGLGRPKGKQTYELYNLADDPQEANDLFATPGPERDRMLHLMELSDSSIQRSMEGLDYPEKKVTPGNPEPRFWTDVEAYKPYFEQWIDRPEYSSRIKAKLQEK